MERNEENAIRELYDSLEQSPPGAWDAPSGEVWHSIEARLHKPANRPTALGWARALSLLLLLLLIERCPSGDVTRQAFLLPPYKPETPAKQEKAPSPVLPVQVEAPLLLQRPIAAEPEVLLEQKQDKPMFFNNITELTHIPGLSFSVQRQAQPVLSSFVPPPPARPAKSSAAVSVGPYYAQRYLRRAPETSALFTLEGYRSVGIEAAYGPLTAGLEWSWQRWQSVHALALTYREDNSRIDDRGRLVREYNNAPLSGAFGEGELDITLANARQNDGTDIADGETLYLRVRAHTQMTYVSAPIGLEKIWKTGPVYLSLRGGGVFHANLSSRFEIGEIQSLRTRIQPLRADWRVRETSVPKNWIDAYTALRASAPLAKNHFVYFQTEYRHNLTPSFSQQRTGTASIQAGYFFAF